jgi:hypothetical protein
MSLTDLANPVNLAALQRLWMIHLEALNPIFQQPSFESTHSTARYERSAQVRLARAGVLPDCCPRTRPRLLAV